MTVWTFLALGIVLAPGVSHAEMRVWEDITVPFRQTFRFSTAASATVSVNIPADLLTETDRVRIQLDMERTSRRPRPYMVVNNNRAAFYYLGGSDIVSIQTAHLQVGENTLLFADQTPTGDLIFIYKMQLLTP